MFKHPIQVGDDLLIQSKRMRVSGIVKYLGASDDDQRIYMSWPMFHMLAGIKPAAMEGMVIVKHDANINLVAAQVRYQLSQQDVVDKFAVYTPDKIKNLAGSIVSIVELALILIALVSLLVGAVGIMNTMYTSVMERTKQIGIMKAIGASSESILALFLIESGVIGVIGGLIGIAGGIGIAILSGIAASSLGGISGLFSFGSLDYLGFLVVLVVTLMTGIIAGILPARQAANMEPAEALRYE
jgi:putative ABC transport system permease protein